MKQNKSSFLNLDANITILIAYLGGLVLKWLETSCYFAWAIPLIIYLIESKNEFVKKQSSQATFLFLISSLLSGLVYLMLLIFAPDKTQDIYNMIITGSLFLVGVVSIFSTIVAIAITIFTIVAIIKTYNYEDYDIPYLSKYLDKFRSFLEKLDGNPKIKEKTCNCQKCESETNKTEKESPRIKPHKIRKRETNPIKEVKKETESKGINKKTEKKEKEETK